MNVPLLVAGGLSVLAAAVHGGAGEALVVRRLSPERLPSSPFGGPRMTKTMIRASWHLTTVGFLAVGCSLLLAGSVLEGDIARGVAMAAAGGASGFAVVVVAAGAMGGTPRPLFRHPAPLVLSAVAVLAWWGVAS